jgi:hypothetical protein
MLRVALRPRAGTPLYAGEPAPIARTTPAGAAVFAPFLHVPLDLNRLILGARSHGARHPAQAARDPGPSSSLRLQRPGSSSDTDEMVGYAFGAPRPCGAAAVPLGARRSTQLRPRLDGALVLERGLPRPQRLANRIPGPTRSRAISLIVLPLTKCARRLRKRLTISNYGCAVSGKPASSAKFQVLAIGAEPLTADY